MKTLCGFRFALTALVAFLTLASISRADTPTATPTPNCPAVTVNGTDGAGSGSFLGSSYQIDVSSGTVLVVGITGPTSQSTTAVTFNGVTLTKGAQSSGGGSRQEIWYMLNPPQGTYPLYLYMGSSAKWGYIAQDFTGISSIGNTNSAAASGTSIGLDFPTTSQNSVLVSVIGQALTGTTMSSDAYTVFDDQIGTTLPYETYFAHKFTTSTGIYGNTFTSNKSGNINLTMMELIASDTYSACSGASAYTPTPGASPTATLTDTPTNTPTNTPSATPTATPSATPTASPTNTPSATPSATPTATPSATPTASFTPAGSPSATPMASATPTTTPVVGSVKTPEFQYLWWKINSQQPSRLISVNLTESTDWVTIPLNCWDVAGTVTLYNTGQQTLYWWLDSYMTTPLFEGYKLAKNTDPLTLKIWPGAKLHYRYANNGGAAIMQNRW